MLDDLLLPFGSCNDITIMPGRDEPLPLEIAEVYAEFVLKRLIFVRVGNEDLQGWNWHDLLLYECNPFTCGCNRFVLHYTWKRSCCHVRRRELSSSEYPVVKTVKTE